MLCNRTMSDEIVEQRKWAVWNSDFANANDPPDRTISEQRSIVNRHFELKTYRQLNS